MTVDENGEVVPGGSVVSVISFDSDESREENMATDDDTGDATMIILVVLLVPLAIGIVVALFCWIRRCKRKRQVGATDDISKQSINIEHDENIGIEEIGEGEDNKMRGSTEVIHL